MVVEVEKHHPWNPQPRAHILGRYNFTVVKEDFILCGRIRTDLLTGMGHRPITVLSYYFQIRSTGLNILLLS